MNNNLHLEMKVGKYHESHNGELIKARRRKIKVETKTRVAVLGKISTHVQCDYPISTGLKSFFFSLKLQIILYDNHIKLGNWSQEIE